MAEKSPNAYAFGPSGLKPYKIAEAAVPYAARAYGTSIGVHEREGTGVVEQLRAGLAFSAFEQLQKALKVPAKLLSDIVHIPVRTLNRRKQQGRFDVSESERVFRLARLFDHAKDVLGNEADAAGWLKSPAKGLGYETPLSHADTEPGAHEIHDLLGRIEHGVFT